MEFVRIRNAIKGRKKVLRLWVSGVLWAMCLETLSAHRSPLRKLAFWFCSSFFVPFLPTSVLSSFHVASQHSLILHHWDRTDVLPWGAVKTVADVCTNSCKNLLLIWIVFLIGFCKEGSWQGNGVVLGSVSDSVSGLGLSLGPAILKPPLYEQLQPSRSISRMSPPTEVLCCFLWGNSIISSQYLNCLGKQLSTLSIMHILWE